MKINKWGIKIAAFALGSSLLFASAAETQAASTYTVQPGDTLYTIGLKHNVSSQNLMTWNSLASSTIYVGQTLAINVDEPVPTSPTNVSTHTVQPGETLFKIASKYGVTTNNLITWNKLASSTIYVGQTLNVGSSVDSSVNVSSKIIATAKQYLGVKYVFGGASPTAGFDCSGFVTYVYNKSGITMSRKTAEGFYNAAKKTTSPKVGDLVFFKDTYKAGISHIGIYLGNNQMISASGTKVQIENIHSAYWHKHFVGYGSLS